MRVQVIRRPFDDARLFGMRGVGVAGHDDGGRGTANMSGLFLASQFFD